MPAPLPGITLDGKVSRLQNATNLPPSASMATERIPGPLGTDDTSGTVLQTNAPSGAEERAAAPTYDQFIELVFNAAIADRQRQGRTHFPAVPDSELAIVEGGHRMRTIPADSARRLLADARAQLQRDQAGPPRPPPGSGEEPDGDEDGEEPEVDPQTALARSVAMIGVGSAYRDYAREERIWRGLFRQYYNATQGRRDRAEGGPHGPAAVQIMVRYYSPRKAPPGFSNHSDGRAIDFITRQGGTLYTAQGSQRAGWRTTWLHRWLVPNAGTYGFHALASEEWHWDHR